MAQARQAPNAAHADEASGGNQGLREPGVVHRGSRPQSAALPLFFGDRQLDRRWLLEPSASGRSMERTCARAVGRKGCTRCPSRCRAGGGGGLRASGGRGDARGPDILKATVGMHTKFNLDHALIRSTKLALTKRAG
eukprot:SAG31_NODE_505_length_14757_cov_20.172943_13_plen_137_part_00